MRRSHWSKYSRYPTKPQNSPVTHVQRNGSDNFVDANNGEAQSYRPSQGDRESQAQSQPQQRHQPQQYHSYNNGSQSNGYASSEQQYYDQTKPTTSTPTPTTTTATI